VLTSYRYMVPPFLVLYGVITNDISYMHEAVQQCSLYRAVLVSRSPPGGRGNGLWQHIVGPEKADPGYWSTSNGWAAAGMCRVLATIKHWRLTPQDQQINSSGPEGNFTFDPVVECTRLIHWVMEIIHGAILVDDDPSGLLRNYLHSSGTEEPWFGEVSGTALLASVVFRMLVLTPEVVSTSVHQWAEKKYNIVLASVDDKGIAKPTVQPLDHGLRQPLMTGSPEGQAFVILMEAARRDWYLRNQL
jgi:rhamnogalacturonyl hydrolase YesR